MNRLLTIELKSKKEKIMATTEAMNQQQFKQVTTEIKRRFGTKQALFVEANAIMGFRISDALSLKTTDVQQSLKSQRLTITESKTGKTRTIKTHGRLHGLLKRLVELSSDDYFLMQGKAGKPLTRQTAYNWLKMAAVVLTEKINVGTHSLRKMIGRKLLDAGVHISKIQAFFNHSSPETTTIYLGLGQCDVDSCLDILTT